MTAATPAPAPSALTLVRPPEPALVRPASATGPFAHALARATDAPADPARDAAEMLVATALVQPILAQSREASMAVEPFAPGPAEKRFGGLLDQHLADRIVGATRFPLVEELARRMASPAGPHGIPTFPGRGVIA